MASQAGIRAELEELSHKAESLRNDYLLLLQRRSAIRKQLRGLAADMGCECDDNFCHTEKREQPVGAGETDRFCHDDQDIGQLSIRCLEGSVDVIISRAVWYEPKEYDRKTLNAGASWSRDIAAADDWFDQTNIVEVRGLQDSKYNLDFKSWDV